jgi:hypothetical protein
VRFVRRRVRPTTLAAGDPQTTVGALGARYGVREESSFLCRRACVAGERASRALAAVIAAIDAATVDVINYSIDDGDPSGAGGSGPYVLRFAAADNLPGVRAR